MAMPASETIKGMSEGIIDQTGLYAAPIKPAQNTATVKVTFVTDPTIFAVVILNPAPAE